MELTVTDYAADHFHLFLPSACMVAKSGNMGDIFGLVTYSVINDNMSLGSHDIIISVNILHSRCVTLG